MTEKCWIDTQAMMSIMAKAKEKYPLETGGVLIGYHKGQDVIITDIIGPGHGAIHEQFYFEGDTDWQKIKMDEIYDATDGRLRYLGDWHSHPDGPINASPLDLEAMKIVRDAPEALTPEPLMLIIGGDFSKIWFEVWELADSNLRSLPIKEFQFDRECLNA